jgi:hypothetical protein
MQEKLRFWGLDVHAETIAVARQADIEAGPLRACPWPCPSNP